MRLAWGLSWRFPYLLNREQSRDITYFLPLNIITHMWLEQPFGTMRAASLRRQTSMLRMAQWKDRKNWAAAQILDFFYVSIKCNCLSYFYFLFSVTCHQKHSNGFTETEDFRNTKIWIEYVMLLSTCFFPTYRKEAETLNEEMFKM